MREFPDVSSLGWWEAATITATVLAAFVQIVSWIFSLVAYYAKELPENHVLSQLSHKVNWDRSALILAGIAALVALAGSIFSIRYARLTDKDSLEVHRQLTVASDQSFSATEKARQALLELTQTEGRLAAVTQQLADAEQQVATAKETLQAVERGADLNLIITRII
jgi:hypothetical protein